MLAGYSTAAGSTTLMRLGCDTASGKGRCKGTAILIVTSTHSGRDTTWVSLLTTGFKTPLKQTNAKVIAIWPSRGGNLGVILVRVCEPVFQNLPHSYTWPLKKRTHSYTWSSKMLTYSYTALWFCTHFFCWLLDKYHSQFMKYQENKKSQKISERNICAYTRM